jgi:crossover junction endodeoxyribonuclease RusA
MNMTFTVPGAPKPKERARRSPQGHFYTPHATENFEEKVKVYALQAMSRARWPVRTTERCAVTLHVHFARGGDGDNAFKAVTDAMNKLVYADDRQVFEMHVFKYTGSDRPRVDVEVAILAGGKS